MEIWNFFFEVQYYASVMSWVQNVAMLRKFLKSDGSFIIILLSSTKKTKTKSEISNLESRYQIPIYKPVRGRYPSSASQLAA